MFITISVIGHLTGDTRKIFVSIFKTVDESHSARVLIGCKPIIGHPNRNLVKKQRQAERRPVMIVGLK